MLAETVRPLVVEAVAVREFFGGRRNRLTGHRLQPRSWRLVRMSLPSSLAALLVQTCRPLRSQGGRSPSAGSPRWAGSAADRRLDNTRSGSISMCSARRPGKKIARARGDLCCLTDVRRRLRQGGNIAATAAAASKPATATTHGRATWLFFLPLVITLAECMGAPREPRFPRNTFTFCSIASCNVNRQGRQGALRAHRQGRKGQIPNPRLPLRTLASLAVRPA